MERKRLERNLSLYRVYVATGEPFFWAPILIASIMSLGKMTLGEVFFMEGVVMLAYGFVEVNTGALADRLGRKYTIVLGKILETIGFTWFAFMDSPLDAWVANCIFMLGLSFCSGAERTLMTQTFSKLGYDKDEAKACFYALEGKVQSYCFLIVACASIVSGFLAEIDLRLPLFLSIPVLSVSIVTACFFTEVPNGTEVSLRKYRYSESGFFGTLSSLYRFTQSIRNTVLYGWKTYKTTNGLLWLTLTFALLGISSKAWHFTYNPYFALTDVSYRYYGYIYCALNLVSWFFSKESKRILKGISVQTVVSLMVFTIGVPIILMGVFVYPLSGLFVLFQNFTRGVSKPFFGSEMHYIIPNDEVRATIDSIDSGIRSGMQAIAMFIFSWILDTYPLPPVLIGLGTIVLLLGVWCIATYKKHSSN